MGTNQPEKTRHRRTENIKLFGECENTSDQNNQFKEGWYGRVRQNLWLQEFIQQLVGRLWIANV
jgi:hypothetical protein